MFNCLVVIHLVLILFYLGHLDNNSNKAIVITIAILTPVYISIIGWLRYLNVGIVNYLPIIYIIGGIYSFVKIFQKWGEIMDYFGESVMMLFYFVLPCSLAITCGPYMIESSLRDDCKNSNPSSEYTMEFVYSEDDDNTTWNLDVTFLEQESGVVEIYKATKDDPMPIQPEEYFSFQQREDNSTIYHLFDDESCTISAGYMEIFKENGTVVHCDLYLKPYDMVQCYIDTYSVYGVVE